MRHRAEARSGPRARTLTAHAAPVPWRVAVPEARFAEVSFADTGPAEPTSDSSALASLDALESPDFAEMGFAEVTPSSTTIAPPGFDTSAVTSAPPPDEVTTFTPPPSAPPTLTPPPTPLPTPLPSAPPTTPAPPASRLPSIEVDVTLLERTLVTDAPVRPPEPSRVRAIETRFAEPPAMELLDLDAELSLPAGAERDPFASEPELLESRSRLVTAAPARPIDVERDAREERVAEAELAATPTPVAPLSVAPTAVASATRGERGQDEDARRGRPSGPLPIDDRDLHDLDGLDALEELVEDAAPSSSRRPITLEEKMREVEGDDDALHTAPPESGRQPAALPIDLELSPDVAAVRGTEERVHTTHTTPAAHATSAPHVRPEMTRPAPASGESVAAFIGLPPDPRAATFGELLDDALDV
jgi:hypothetical protein